MISRELVEKINTLWRKQQTTGLTEEEKLEQKAAREEYLAGIRSQVRDMLENVKRPEDAPKSEHTSGCTCHDCKH